MKDMNMKIIEYEPQFKEDFVRLNTEWITQYFQLENPDYRLFENPEKIITDGGNIFFVLHDDKVTGTAALLAEDGGKVYEIAKMAVTPEYRGKGIGETLLKHLLDYAKQHKAVRLYLISNTTLKPAIKLYEKLGFKQILGKENDYTRGDYMAELFLTV
jgi:ribosomal protein S18 acetylase RimI-like enzyme